jgi:hypothetical protein
MGPISAKLFFAPGWTEMNIERWIGKDEEKTNIEHPTRHRRASTCSPPADRILNRKKKDPEMVKIYSACTTDQKT